MFQVDNLYRCSLPFGRLAVRREKTHDAMRCDAMRCLTTRDGFDCCSMIVVVRVVLLNRCCNCQAHTHTHTELRRSCMSSMSVCQAGGRRAVTLSSWLFFKWFLSETPISASLAFLAPDTARTPQRQKGRQTRETSRRDTPGSCHRASHLKWLQVPPLLHAHNCHFSSSVWLPLLVHWDTAHYVIPCLLCFQNPGPMVQTEVSEQANASYS